MRDKPKPRDGEQELMADIFSFANDPYAFVLYAFPWGQEGTPLEKFKSPRKWQIEVLCEMRDHIAETQERDDFALFKKAMSSGRGIGKSALLSWVALWMFCTVPGSTTIVTANTDAQLKTKTFPEIRKWATMSIVKNWFEHLATMLKPADWLSEALRDSVQQDDAYWYISAQLWSEENPDAFAGMHSQLGMMVLFDEASGIPHPIWPVTEGFFTDDILHRFWLTISNPRNPTGPFFECFHSNRKVWNPTSIDARTVEGTDQKLYQGIITQYGADSDQARVEVYGQFPRQGDTQFISRQLVIDAGERELFEDEGAPLVMGVDPARYGDDEAVIRLRQGRDARSFKPIVQAKSSLTTLATKCAEVIDRMNPDAVIIEGDGVGGGLVDILRSWGYKVTETTMGSGSDDKQRYANKRTEIWGAMGEWLETAYLDPLDEDLTDDLCTPQYEYTQNGQLKMEAKEKMRKRGYPSPNHADALAITFAVKVGRKDIRMNARRRNRVARHVDYDLFA
jgi:hypothetical protein